MSKPILIIGKSGSGKSRSIKNLDPKTTFIINVIGKDLPFKGWKKNYSLFDGKKGNVLNIDDPAKIMKTMDFLADKMPDIKTIIIDDFQYIMANEFMRRGKEKGFEKFTEIGQHAWEILWKAKWLGDDRIVVFLAHSDTNDANETKCKTIGKLLDDKICIEGMFTIVLNTAYEDGKYFFETQTSGQNTTKSPEGMFGSIRIENDLQLVINSIKSYEEE